MDDRLIVMLVRHAEPVLPGTPGYGEDDRPLTPAGRAAAERLAKTLARFGEGGGWHSGGGIAQGLLYDPRVGNSDQEIMLDTGGAVALD